MKYTITTIIPVYQDSGLPFEILKRTVNSVISQTYSPIEIILTDDTSGNVVEVWVQNFNKTSKFPITYLRNLGPKGVSSNSNFASKRARGDLLHFLHSDDHIIDVELYFGILKIFEATPSRWILLGGKMNGIVTIPSLESLNLFGVNTVGGPSGFIIKKSIFEEFDENISLLMDIEFFLRTWKKFGMPYISKKISIEYGSGNWQLTKSIDEKKYHAEIEYLWKNRRLTLLDYTYLMRSKESWNVKRDAFAYLISNPKIRKIEKLQIIFQFQLEYFKLRLAIFQTNIHHRIFP